MAPTRMNSENRSGVSTRANTRVCTRPMAKAPPAVVTRSSKYGTEISRAGACAGGWSADADATLACMSGAGRDRAVVDVEAIGLTAAIVDRRRAEAPDHAE